MKNHLIKNIHIKNFKCFDDFKAEGFARVNLIGGKNNVGKTAFLEAAYINSSSVNLKGFVGALDMIKFRRECLNFLTEEYSNDNVQTFIEQSTRIFVETNINCSHFNFKESKGVKSYHFEFNDEYIEVNANEFSFIGEQPKNIAFIGNFGVSNSLIRQSFSSLQKRDSEDYMIRVINKFDSNIDSFKIIDEVPQCKINGKYLPITELGDGTRHLVSIVTSLYASENGHLFIDEIDNGIHYTAIDSIWEIILKLSEELNVQVFVTTHSKECIESYARVAKKLHEKDITYTVLSKLKDGSIDAGVYDSEMLINTLEQDHEVRGW